MKPSLAQTAHADAWAELGAHGLLPDGCGRLPGIRLMATGLAHPQWNSADVTDGAAVDVAGVAEWYRLRGVPWGVRVPVGMAWPHGRRLLGLRLMTLDTRLAREGPTVDGLVVRTAGRDDLDAVVHVDSTAFEADPHRQQPWLRLLLDASLSTLPPSGVTVAVGELGGRVVASGFTVATNGDAGPALYVAGIAVLPDARRRGIAGALSAWLVARGSAAGPRLAHLHPDTDEAARVYGRLGFEERPGLDVYVDNAPG